MIVLFLLTISNVLLAQRSKTIHLAEYDRRKLHYGFQIGYFNSFLQLKHSEIFTYENDSIIGVDGINTGSFSLGLIMNMKLKDELWNLRITPNFAFYQHQIAFKELDLDPEITLVEATMIELPVMLMYKSVRRMNSRMYMIGGLNYALQVGGKVDEGNQSTVIFNRSNLEVTYGFGFHFYMEMFNLAPEIRFSHGLFNMLNQTNNPYSSNLQRISTHKITVLLQFEG